MENLLTVISDYGEYLIPIIFFSIAISIIAYSFFFSNKNIIIREFKKGRRKSINSIRDKEYVKIIGVAKHVNTPLVAPLSGRSCVYYHIVVEVKGDKSWRRIINDVKSQDFFIESSTEMAIIKTKFLEKNTSICHLVKDYKENSGFRNDANNKLEAYLKSHNKKSTGFLGINKTIRYTEGIIELNEKIGVKGIAKWQSLKEPIVGYSYSKILTLEGTKKQKLLITDEPKALIRVQNKI
ncbi:hypothetical protein GCM10022291_16030 [Postechiella marina]|uniref:RING-type E3 ubiquitin transferase n=1 Tax=Postechiella marina TaxID=943941 RepID=A0ABP8C7F9_9FLAO